MQLTASDSDDGLPRFLQTERQTHEAWARLTIDAPKASAVMHLLTARMKKNNTTLLTHAEIQDELGISRPTVQRAIRRLREDCWLEVWQIGETGSVNVYVINDRVAWARDRNGLRYSKLSVELQIREKDQPAEYLKQIDNGPLRKLPSVGAGERQLPSGDGLPPPSEPTLPGMEPDLPARQISELPDFPRDEFSNLQIDRSGD